MHNLLNQAIKHWNHVEPVVYHPKNHKDFDELTELLDELLDIIGDDENHRLMGLADVLGDLVARYEEEHSQNIKASGIDALKYLMQSHHLKQSDLPEIGTQGVMSEILRGKRQLNLRQIKLLSKRFKVNPSTFMDH